MLFVIWMWLFGVVMMVFVFLKMMIVFVVWVVLWVWEILLVFDVLNSVLNFFVCGVRMMGMLSV